MSVRYARSSHVLIYSDGLSMQAIDLSDVRPTVTGWAIECRLNAEDPLRNFSPSSGVLGEVAWPAEVKDPKSGRTAASVSIKVYSRSLQCWWFSLKVTRTRI